MKAMLPDAEMNRLRWRCSYRSMREADVLLGNFLGRRFADLTLEQARIFAGLAEMEDLELWALVSGRRECDSPGQAEIVAMLRDVKIGQAGEL